MLLNKTIIQAIALAASVSACGGNDKKTENQENRSGEQRQVVSAEAAKTELDAAPEFLIVKVPVDAEGNEQNDQFETKEISDNGSFDSAKSTEYSFRSGANAQIVNELDADTSSQQWSGGRAAWYWNTAWYPGKLLGRGLWWGRNPNRWYGGYQYGYSHYRNYSYSGCNYYVYRRPQAVPVRAETPVQLPAGQNYPDQQYPGQQYPANNGQDQQDGYSGDQGNENGQDYQSGQRNQGGQRNQNGQGNLNPIDGNRRN